MNTARRRIASAILQRVDANPHMWSWARHRYTWALADGLTWFLAIWVAALLRRLYVSAPLGVSWLAVTSLAAAVIFWVFAAMRGLYQRGRVRGSYDEIVRVVQSSAATGLVLLAAAMLPLGPDAIAGTIPAIATALAMAGVLALRALARVLRVRNRTQRTAGGARAGQVPTILLGAGAAARTLVQQLKADAGGAYQLVAVLDDDPMKTGVRLGDLTVRGDRSNLRTLTWRYDVRQLIVAIPSADADTLRGICRAADQLDLRVLVLPSESERLGRPLALADLRPVRVDDLVGRARLAPEGEACASLLRGKNVLVTGAGGTLGAEIARRVAHLGAGQITLLDIDQPALHAVQLDLQHQGEPLLGSAVIADIRDPQQVHAAFEIAAPHVVIHTAGIHDGPRVDALPEEAWRTNVIGTANLLDGARANGASVFVNVSSHAAADPQTVLGASQRIAERLTGSVADQAGARYFSVRLPDLVGVRHGGLATAQEQLRRDLPLTAVSTARAGYVRVHDAAQLVLQALATVPAGRVCTVRSADTVDADGISYALSWAGPPQLPSRASRDRSRPHGVHGEKVRA